MKQSDPLELADPGALDRPGLIGRTVRLVLGLLCLLALAEIVQSWSMTVDQPATTLGNRYLVLLAPLCIFNYVVNIGFAKSWGRRPLIVSVIVLASAAGGAFFFTGSLDSQLFGIPLNLWLGYFYAHLGLSFILSAAIATPGCEMRSIPELLGRARGKPSHEHHCPAAFISKLDAWERERRTSA